MKQQKNLFTERINYNHRVEMNCTMSINPSIYNIIRWVAWTMGQMNRPQKRLMFQVLFFYMISCKILCKNPLNLFSYSFIKLQR